MQGNRAQFCIASTTLAKYLSLHPALWRLFFIPTLEVFSFFNAFKATCLTIAKFPAAFPFRTLQSSSRKEMSKLQWVRLI